MSEGTDSETSGHAFRTLNSGTWLWMQGYAIAVATSDRQVFPVSQGFPCLHCIPTEQVGHGGLERGTSPCRDQDRVRTGTGSRTLTPNPTHGLGAVQTLRREDQVCHSCTLYHVPRHQEASVSLRLASGVPREDITGLPVRTPPLPWPTSRSILWVSGPGRAGQTWGVRARTHLSMHLLAPPVGQRQEGRKE